MSTKSTEYVKEQLSKHPKLSVKPNYKYGGLTVESDEFHPDRNPIWVIKTFENRFQVLPNDGGERFDLSAEEAILVVEGFLDGNKRY